MRRSIRRANFPVRQRMPSSVRGNARLAFARTIEKNGRWGKQAVGESMREFGEIRQEGGKLRRKWG